ncbi:MAG TPA: hypothetical protein VFG45_10540 [Candidatus Nitrosocosmicus sp.]|nr:hypothetical protein [Candidatus Nitrosocosmicus sp.]
MQNKDNEEQIWSDWLDFGDPEIISSTVSDQAGVFKVHASMKILYIGSSMNVKQSLLEFMYDPCVGKAKRFSYLITKNHEEVKNQMLIAFRESHGGKLPSCMESQQI